MNHIDFKLTKQSNVNNKENLYCCPDHIVYAFGINKLLNCGCKNYVNLFVATFHVFITIVVKHVSFQQSLMCYEHNKSSRMWWWIIKLRPKLGIKANEH